MLYFFATIGFIFTALAVISAIAFTAWIFDIWRP